MFGVSEYDFGELRGNGAKAFYDFVYTNTGSSPLLITGVSTSCTCSKASFSKKPTMPGEKGAIRITYDPRKQGSPGMFYKAVQVFCNTPQRRVIIIIKGSVTQ